MGPGRTDPPGPVQVDRTKRIADRYLQKWGGLASGLPHLQTAASDLNADDQYGLAHLIGHLLRAGRFGDLNRLFEAQSSVGVTAVNTWFDVHDRIGDLAGYLRDLSTARHRAEVVTAGDSIGLEIRYALCEASIASLAASIPLALLERLTQTRRWDPATCPRVLTTIV